MNRLAAPLALVLMLSLLAPGCTFMQHRSLDLEQSFHFGIGASVMPGVLAHAHVPLLGATLGLLPDSTYVGSDFGYTHRWLLRGGGLGVFGNLTRELDRGQSPFGMSVGDDAYVSSLEIVFWHVRERDRRLGSTLFSNSQVELDLHALFVGVSLGVDIVQLLDFFTGWFGLDLLEDDGVDYGAELEQEADAPTGAPAGSGGEQ